MRSAPLLRTEGTRVGRVWIATGILERMRGLLGRDELPRGELLLLEPCGSVHTFGMRFAIDVLFLDRGWRVIGVRRALRSGRIAWGGPRARRTLEAEAGWLDLEALRGARLRTPGD